MPTRTADQVIQQGMENATQEEARAGQLVAEALTKRGFLMELRVSRWSGRTRLSESDLGLDGLTDAALHRLGQRQLVPADAVARIAAVEARARKRVEQVSYPFPIASARFVPAPVLGPLLADLARIRDEFRVEVSALCLHYDELATQQRAAWRANAEKLKAERGLTDEWLESFDARLLAQYPTAEEVQQSFSMGWNMFQFALPKGMRTRLVGSEEALQAARLAEEARAQVEAQVSQFVGEAAVELRRRAGELCAHVARQVRENGERIGEKSLQPLRDLIAQFRAMDFTGDDGVAAELERFQSEVLGVDRSANTAERLRGDADYRASMATALDDMAKRAVGESDKAAAEALERFLTFGRQGRAVE